MVQHAQDGNLDLEPVEPQTKEGYCSYEDFKRGLDAFFDVAKPKREPIEARLDSMRDVDPNLVRSAFRDEG